MFTFEESVKEFSKLLDWIEVNWNAFHETTLNLSRTHPIRFLSPIPCLKISCSQMDALQYKLGHIAPLLSNLPWLSMNVEPHGLWTLTEQQGPTRPGPGCPLDLPSHPCPRPTLLHAGSISASGISQACPASGNLHLALSFPGMLFIQASHEAPSLFSPISDLFNRNFSKHLISMMTQSHSISPHFSVLQGTLSTWKDPCVADWSISH